MIWDSVQYKFHAASVQGLRELFKIAQASQVRVHSVVIRSMVAV